MTLFTGADRLVNYTLAVMQFGQFINHDMELTNQFTYRNQISFIRSELFSNELNRSKRNGNLVLQQYYRNACRFVDKPGLHGNLSFSQRSVLRPEEYIANLHEFRPNRRWIAQQLQSRLC